ncbi:MAG TPA: ribose-phosphate pyrophosphokinase [Clostridia bacterium]|jgi:ribose-phosphate pyrophosphokinase|nr:ribose-phosphate pyrophosphokinase [Clostridiaceae bacterium]HPZ52266.1 ribose-phosphate pyrophosphokinase [Clostridia bacterium]
MNRKRAPFSSHSFPVGPLGLIGMESCQDLAQKVDEWLIAMREEETQQKASSFLIKNRCPRFGNGEAKGIIDESIRGKDLYILIDVGNYGCTYNIMGRENVKSPDDHFMDLKRIISAIGGKGKRINIIMPFLYGGRQHRRVIRESLDCALALHELQNLGISNIITFDAHDSRVQNSIPNISFENILPYYQFTKALLIAEPDIKIDKENLMIVSPDEGGIHRNLYYSSIFGINLGIFIKRRDYSTMVNGRNPIVAHEFIGDDVEGKDILVVDDMISSGDSLLDIAYELKRRKARKIYCAVTYALFTDGIDLFNKAYEDGALNRVFATNLTYRRPELKDAEWFVEVDMSKYIAKLIDALNYDESLGVLVNPAQRIISLLEKHSNGEPIV